MAMVRSLSMVGHVPVKVSQLASLFMPYPAFSAMPTKRKSLAMVGLRSSECIFPQQIHRCTRTTDTQGHAAERRGQG